MDNIDDITPAPSLAEDYSDLASDSPSVERRRHQRGGRKKSERESRLPPVPKPAPNDDPQEDETLEEYNQRIRMRNLNSTNRNEAQHEGDENQTHGDYYGVDEGDNEPEESGTVCDRCKQKTRSSAQPDSPFETGIKAFNVKRAQNSGGRPFGVRATSHSAKPKKSAAKKTKKQREKAAKEEMESSTEDSDRKDSENERKPMSIRLDLNLMVEIFLKAKIKGDVTITFL
jgi:hypothetical protein